MKKAQKRTRQHKPAPTPPGKPHTIHVEGFVEEIERANLTMKNRRFAFILGAGASKSSGIKTGGEFVQEWLKILYARDSARGSLSYDQWIADNRTGIANFDPAKAAEFYPQAYAATFEGDPDAGYAYLEASMKHADPRYGYAVLAFILETTQHKVVITTNFDNLVADSLANYSNTFPLICGHDSLAGFAQPNLRRPLILKVHHDLLLAPKSLPQELGKLGEGYTRAVERLLQHYTPIVIGYGGNDGSLMGVLENLDPASVPGGIYWCYLAGDQEPREQIQRAVAKQNGHLIAIRGFDELMAMLGDKLGFILPDESIKQRAEKRASQLLEHAKELKAKLQAQQPATPTKAGAQPAAEEQQSREASLKSLNATLERTDGKRRWWQWAMQAEELKKKDPEKADQMYREALQELPDTAPLLGSYAFFLTDVRKDNDRAQELYERSLKADPNYAINLGNYALFLTTVRKDNDRAQELYERALKADPNHAAILGNYALFLRNERKDDDRAQEMYERALKADPNHANNLGNYANFLTTVRKDNDRAQDLYERALEADPNDATNLGNYALFLTNVHKDNDRAQELYERSLKADPNNATNLGNYALFLTTVRKDNDRAQELYERSLKADPNNANNLGNYAATAFVLGNLERATQLLARAFEHLSGDSTPGLDVELWFYAFAHGPEKERPVALSKLKQLILQKGSRSPGWDLSQNVQRATADGHSEAAWLPKLASVINGNADVAILNGWPAWQKA